MENRIFDNLVFAALTIDCFMGLFFLVRAMAEFNQLIQ